LRQSWPKAAQSCTKLLDSPSSLHLAADWPSQKGLLGAHFKATQAPPLQTVVPLHALVVHMWLMGSQTFILLNDSH
jgi:hypothetical protein